MRDINRVLLKGRLGCEPTLRQTKNGIAVASFTMATETFLKTKNESETTWHRIVVWGRPAIKCGNDLKKGMTVFIEGKFRTRKWEDEKGVANYMHEVHTDRITFVDSRMTYKATTLEIESGAESLPLPVNVEFNH